MTPTQPEMPQLGSIRLPPEIWIKICGYLCRHCQGEHATVMPEFTHEADEAGIEPKTMGEGCAHQGQTALLNLTKTCRALYAVAGPVLYHYISTTSPFDPRFLLRTLSHRPDLGTRTSELDFGRVIAPLSPMEAESDGDILEGVSNTKPWTVPDGVVYARLISQLLPLLPNLERAHFCLPQEVLLQCQAQPEFLATSLKRLDLSGKRDDTKMPDFAIDGLGPMFRMAPNLETLHCHSYVWSTEREDLLPSFRNSLQNLTELNLAGTYQNLDGLGSLMEAVGPKLSKVSIWLARVVDIGIALQLNDIIEHLQPWTRTLRELSVALHKTESPLEAHAFTNLHILREFRALEILRTQAISFDFDGRLVAAERALTFPLPSSLRELRLLGESDMGPALQHLLIAFQAGEFPELTKIEIDEQHRQREDTRQLKEIGAGFLAEGVEFIVHPDVDCSLSIFYPANEQARA